MNSIKLIDFICLVSICCSLEINYKTVDNNSKSNVTLRHKRKPRLVPNYGNQLNYENIKLRLDLNDIILPKITQRKKNCNKSILLRQKRGLPVSNSQNKLNNDSIKLRLDLNNLLPKISHQRPHIMIHPPITNLRAKPRPGPVLHNKVNPAIISASQPNLYNSVKIIPTLPPEPSKQNAETKPVIPVTKYITKSAPEQKTEKFYIEIEEDEKIDKKPDTAVPNPTLQSRVKETVLTKLNEETIDGKKDKDSVIIGIMRELPDIIKNVMNETVKSEENPIIIKNITEINSSIQRDGETKTDIQLGDIIEKEVQKDTRPSHKAERINNEADERHCEEVMSLLLKPILQPKQHKAEVPHLLSHVTLAENVEVPHSSTLVPLQNNAENEIETIEIIQNKYSEIVEQKHELLLNKTEENHTKEEHLVPYTILHGDQITVPTFYQNAYNSDSTYIRPSVEAVTHTKNPNIYNVIPMHSTPVDMYAGYSNVYPTPSEMYGKSPYEYSELQQSFSMDSALGKPKCSLATNNRPQNIEADNFDDGKNTKWKTWSNTEIFIKTNHNHADWQNQRPALMPNWGHPFYNGCNYCYFQNHVLPINRKNPCSVYQNYYPTYQESFAQKNPEKVIASEYF